MENLKSNKVFKEKKTVKQELLNSLENGIKLNYSSLAKAVGISVHRVKKYCKNHDINLENYNSEILNAKKVKKDFEEVTLKSKKRKLKVEPLNNKINIGSPKEVKASLNKKI